MTYFVAVFRNSAEKGGYLFLLGSMIHYVNGLESGAGRDLEKLLEYETRYDQILERALAEYADVPCSE